MLLIIALSRPLNDAIDLVFVIGLPMIILNSLGVALFISVFESIFISTEAYSARKVGLVLDIAQRCLPFLRKGINDIPSLEQAALIILELSSANMVAIANTENILVKKSSDNITKETTIHQILSEAQFKQFGEPSITSLDKCYYISTALSENDQTIGYLIISMPVNNLLLQSKVKFVDGLAKIMSTQLELAQIEKSNELIKKAEFDALQSQINPHFLFNVLNTIISVSRSDSEKARHLLVNLSIYFRNVLKHEKQFISINEELDNVRTYLNLEKARFEDTLTFDITQQHQSNCLVPRFIVQPIVENAIKHGLKHKQNGLVKLSTAEANNFLIIDVHDNGQGIDDLVVEHLKNNKLDENKIGLSNVNQRLMSFYGSAYGLIIDNSNGTLVTIKVPIKEMKK